MTRSLAVPVSRHAAAWQLCLAAAPLLIGCYFLLGELGARWATAQTACYVSANVVLAVAAAVAAKRNRSVRAGFLLIALSAAGSAAADVVYYYLALVHGQEVYPSVADIGYLADYPALAGGLLIIVRRRTPGWDGASMLDATIVAIGSGFLVYALVIVPTVRTGGDHFTTLVSVAYPVGDLMLISVGARLLLGAGSRTWSLAALGTYLTLVLYADTTYSVQSLNGTFQAGGYLDAVWMTAGLVLAAGVLHPSVRTMVAPSPVATPDAPPGRIVVLAAAALVAPTTLLVQHLRGERAPVISATIVCNVLFLLVLARMAGLVRAQRQTAITDGLTGLRTRRYFGEALRSETARTARSGGPIGVLLLDIDHFKNVNDTYGHSGGDAVLVEVAARLRRLVRPGDVVARYGGEEFAVLLPGADPAEAEIIGERIRRGIATAPIATGSVAAGSVAAGSVAAGAIAAGSIPCERVTVSVGVAVLTGPAGDADGLVLAADRALYAAKNAGRDRVSAAWS